jgi:trimethylamine--corrinoid protein Co-methyltransferase
MTRRNRERTRRTKDSEPQEQPFTLMKRPYRPIEVMSADEVEFIHQMSLRLLRDVGLRFDLEEAWPILEANGCSVDRSSGLTKFPPEVVDHFLALTPSEFTLLARDPAKSLHMGGDYIHYGSASSAPNVMDLDNGRRPGTQKDFDNLVKINHMIGSCHFHTGHPVEPIDAPANTRHLTSTLSWATLSDKVYRNYCIGATRALDAMAMTQIAHQVDDATFEQAPRLMGIINVNSPLVMDAPLLEGAIELVKRGQLVVVSPVAFAGAMSPITLSGSLVQTNAEAIGVMAFLQMVAPGAPLIYGVLTTPVDMKSGAPAMGVPETVTGTLANGQMARYYNVPQRVMLGSTSNAVDGQAAYESMMSIWGNMLSGAHIVFHAHGWMEGGLTTSYEKTIMDAEMIQMIGALTPRIDMTDMEEVMHAIAEVGPGGHFLNSDHTMPRYMTAFHRPLISDWRPYEHWSAAGSPATDQRANAKWKAMLKAYRPPPMEAGVREALEGYVARRSEEIGDRAI